MTPLDDERELDELTVQPEVPEGLVDEDVVAYDDGHDLADDDDTVRPEAGIVPDDPEES